MADEIAFAPAKKLASLIRRKKIGCLELLEHSRGPECAPDCECILHDLRAVLGYTAVPV